MMTGKQWHYTSCEYGSSGHAGFQTRFLSPQLRDEAISKLETMASYVAPRGSEQNAASCPKALRFKVDGNENYYLVSSVYTGTDYSGRYGNYYSHGLLFGSLPENTAIVDIISKISWVEGIAAGDDKPRDNYNIPDMEVNDLQTSGLEAATSFFKKMSESDKQTLLSKALMALFKQQEQQRKLVFRCPEDAEQIMWVNWIHKAFPTCYQKYLSFSTYQHSTSTDYAINFAFDNSQFQFDEAEVEYQFYTIDLETGRCSSGLEDNNDYVRILSQCYTNGEDAISAFRDFVSKFKSSGINDTLNAIARLFESRVNERTQLSEEALNEALELVQYKSLDNYRIELALPLKDLISSRNMEQSHRLLKNILLFHCTLLKANSDAQLLQESNELFIALQSAYWHNTKPDSQTYSKLLQTLSSVQNDEQDFARKCFLATDIIEDLNKNRHAVHRDKILDHYEVLVAKLSLNELFKSGSFLTLVDCVASSSNNDVAFLTRLFKPISQRLDYTRVLVEALLNRTSGKPDSKNAHEALMEIIADVLGTDKGWNIIFELYDDPRQKTHISEFILYVIDSAKDNSEIFSFFSNTIAKLKIQNDSLKDLIYKKIWQNFNEKQRDEMAVNWFKEGLHYHLDGKQQIELFVYLNRCISLNITSPLPSFVDNSYESQLSDLPRKLVPNALFLRKFLEEVESVEAKHISELNKHLELLEADAYEEFLFCYFKKQLNWKTYIDPEQQSNAILAVFCSKHFELFNQYYYDRISAEIFRKDLDHLKVFLENWLLLYTKLARKNLLQPFFESMHKNLVSDLAKVSKENMKELNKHIPNSSKIKEAELRLFQSLLDDVEYKKLTLIQKLKKEIISARNKVEVLFGKLKR